MHNFPVDPLCRLPGVSPASATSRTERWPLKRSKSTKDKSPVPPTPPAPDETVTTDQQEKPSPSSTSTAAARARESKLESPQNDEAKVAASPSTISAVAQAKVLDAIETNKKNEGKDDAQIAAPSSTAGDSGSPAAIAAAEKRAKERAESEEAARRVDPSTGMMKSFTLADLMERNSSFSSGQVSGSSNFEIKVDGVGTTSTSHDSVNRSAESEKQFYAVAAEALNLVGSSSSSSGTPKVPAAPATTAPSPTPTGAGHAASSASGPSPASGPGPSPASAAGSVGAYHRRLGDPSPISIVTAPKSASPAAIAPLPTPLARMRKKQDAADASVVRVSSSNSNKTYSSTSSTTGSRGGVRVPDTPGSGAKAADQAKVFRRLCLVKTASSEAETGDAGAGLGAQGREPTLSFDQVRKCEGQLQKLLCVDL